MYTRGGIENEIKRIEMNARLGVDRVEIFKRYQHPKMEDDTSADGIRSITVQKKIKIGEIVEGIGIECSIAAMGKEDIEKQDPSVEDSKSIEMEGAREENWLIESEKRY